LEDTPGRAKPEVKSTFCHSRVGAAAADQHLASERCEKGRWRLAADQEPVDLLEEEKLLG